MTLRVTLTCVCLVGALLHPLVAVACVCVDMTHWPEGAEIYVVETLEQLPTTVVKSLVAGPTNVREHLYTPLPFTVTSSLLGPMSVGDVDTLYWRGGSYLTPSGERLRIDNSCAVALAEHEQALIVVYPFANGYTMTPCATNKLPIAMSAGSQVGAVLSNESADALTIANKHRHPSEDGVWVSIEAIREALARRSR